MKRKRFSVEQIVAVPGNGRAASGTTCRLLIYGPNGRRVARYGVDRVRVIAHGTYATGEATGSSTMHMVATPCVRSSASPVATASQRAPR
jgi:hypothetical protein